MSEKKLKPEEKNDEDILSALLDFFSDSALGYISAFVACIFGLFATLNLMQSQNFVGFWLLSIVYFFLLLGGVYSLLNFAYYIRLANNAKRELVSKTKFKGDFETTFEENYIHGIEKKSSITNLFLWKPFFWVKDKYVLQFALLGYLFLILTPWIVEFLKKYGFNFLN